MDERTGQSVGVIHNGGDSFVRQHPPPSSPPFLWTDGWTIQIGRMVSLDIVKRQSFPLNPRILINYWVSIQFILGQLSIVVYHFFSHSIESSSAPPPAKRSTWMVLEFNTGPG